MLSCNHRVYCKLQYLHNDVIWLLNGLTDAIITDITSVQRNQCLAEMEPCTVYPLYSITKAKMKFWILLKLLQKLAVTKTKENPHLSNN